MSFSRCCKALMLGANIPEITVKDQIKFKLGHAFESLLLSGKLGAVYNQYPLRTKKGKEFKTINPDSISTTELKHLTKMLVSAQRVKIIKDFCIEDLLQFPHKINKKFKGTLNGVDFIGKPDLVVELANEVLVLEIKTSSSADNFLSCIETMSNYGYVLQVAIYHKLVSQHYKGKKITSKWLFVKKSQPYGSYVVNLNQTMLNSALNSQWNLFNLSYILHLVNKDSYGY